MENLTLFTRVMWHDKKCIVTNAFVCGGKKITISPMGNGNSPAKYFNVYPNDVQPYPDNVRLISITKQ